MLLKDATRRLHPYVLRPFGEFLDPAELCDLRTNKGQVGQILERLLGLTCGSANLDFDDGELKTNKVDRTGRPLETMFITMIASRIDEILSGRAFLETDLCQKLVNILYVPVCKEGAEVGWLFLPPIHADLRTRRYAPLLEQLSEDYASIAAQLAVSIETSDDGFIHTANGQLMQVRSKDSMDACGRYHPIYSEVYGRHVSNKNHAFYFRKQFMRELQDASPDYPIGDRRVRP